MASDEPVAAVHQWWQAWQDQDHLTLARMALEDYIEYPGAGPRRNVGRQRILEVAERAFARMSLRAWTVDDIEVRRHDPVAICSYRWSEQGVRDGADFDLAGFATDVLVLRDGLWTYQSHHVSMLNP
jgi:ketosteroid isomerase-like protein